MPRFGTKSLLIAFVLLAIWFATFSGFTGAQDLRRSLLMLVLVAAGSLAICLRGRWRAFWAAFTIVMLLCGGLDMQRPLHRYVPDFTWQWMMGTAIYPYPAPVYTMSAPPVYSAPPPASPASPSPPAITYMPTPFIPTTPTRVAASLALGDSLVAAWTLVLATIGGSVAAYIYSRAQSATREGVC